MTCIGLFDFRIWTSIAEKKNDIDHLTLADLAPDLRKG